MLCSCKRVAFAGNISRHFFAVGQTHTRNFPQTRSSASSASSSGPASKRLVFAGSRSSTGDLLNFRFFLRFFFTSWLIVGIDNSFRSDSSQKHGIAHIRSARVSAARGWLSAYSESINLFARVDRVNRRRRVVANAPDPQTYRSHSGAGAGKAPGLRWHGSQEPGLGCPGARGQRRCCWQRRSPGGSAGRHCSEVAVSAASGPPPPSNASKRAG